MRNDPIRKTKTIYSKAFYINGQPTLEVDFKAFHPNLLSNELGIKLSGDPYDLGELILPKVITTKEEQRAYVKLLVLMGINADSDKKAYQAFRNSDRKDKLGQSLTDSFSGYLRSYLGTQTRYTHGTHFEITFVLTTVIKQ